MALATVTVLVALLLASWIATRFLPPAWQQVVATPLGYLAPISYLVTAACMALGGAMAGRRFLVVALGMTFALWIATFVLLANIALPTADSTHPLFAVFRMNIASAVLSLAAAALGTDLGARWQAYRALRAVA
ncbi:hypothetical protein C0063_15210 [Pseudoxanthomonas sp. KAs_5_3]|nr:hypothetical protein C0063_15210 [Pseudoxanthomonas sp. KAs_5_3]SFV30925.1 hypothetical protein SAMN05428990_1860 [Pseudoxanthomonas sp. YR558]